MSIEEKQNFQTSQSSDLIEYPQTEKEVSNLIKKFYKSNIPIELVGTGTKRKIGKPLQCAKTLSCLLYTSPSPRDKRQSRMPSSA